MTDTHYRITDPLIRATQVSGPQGALTLMDDDDVFVGDVSEWRRIGDPPTDRTVPLVGWGTFDQMRDQIHARLFGEIVRMAAPIVQDYHSDLYWDARTLPDTVTADGVVFDLCLRRNGTHIGPMARPSAEVNERDAFLFEVTVYAVSGQWHARFHCVQRPAACWRIGA